MNPGCAACRINVYFIFSLFKSERQLKEKTNLYENRSLSRAK